MTKRAVAFHASSLLIRPTLSRSFFLSFFLERKVIATESSGRMEQMNPKYRTGGGAASSPSVLFSTRDIQASVHFFPPISVVNSLLLMTSFLCFYFASFLGSRARITIRFSERPKLTCVHTVSQLFLYLLATSS